MNESISFIDACRTDNQRGNSERYMLVVQRESRSTHSQETTDRSRYAKLNPNTIPMASVRIKDLENR